MNPQTPTAVVRRFYQAFVAGDMPTIAELMTDDVSFHVPGTGSNAGDYQGKDAVFGFFGQAVAKTGGSLKLELLDVMAGEDHVAALATYRAEREGRAPLQNNLVHLIKLRDGRIAQSWFHSRNQYEVDAFWA
jgi:ketosteroid isomerase-like protein